MIMAASLLAVQSASADNIHRAKIKKLEFQFIDTPRFRLVDNPDRAQERNPVQWLEIEAEVDVETLHDSQVIPELTATWHVLLEEPDFDKSNKGEKQLVRLTGEITFTDIRTHGAKTHLVAYVHPDRLTRITGEEHPDKNDIVGVALQLSGQNLISTEKYAGDLEFSDYKKSLRWWANWDRKTYRDHVTPKHESPFAPLWTDRHPAVKRR